MSGGVLGVGALAVTAAALGLLLRSRSRESAFLLTLAAGVAVLMAVAGEILPLVGQLRDWTDRTTLPAAPLTAVLKAVGIALAGELAAHYCRDAGESGLAKAVELAEQIAILTVSLPLLTQVLELIGEMAP